jgi:hypothetical protein
MAVFLSLREGTGQYDFEAQEGLFGGERMPQTIDDAAVVLLALISN